MGLFLVEILSMRLNQNEIRRLFARMVSDLFAHNHMSMIQAVSISKLALHKKKTADLVYTGGLQTTRSLVDVAGEAMARLRDKDDGDNDFAPPCMTRIEPACRSYSPRHPHAVVMVTDRDLDSHGLNTTFFLRMMKDAAIKKHRVSVTSNPHTHRALRLVYGMEESDYVVYVSELIMAEHK
jgi:hypothetical protein